MSSVSEPSPFGACTRLPAGAAHALRVALISRREPGITGTSRYAAALGDALRTLGVRAEPAQTSIRPALARTLGFSARLGVDLGAFFAHYPVGLPARAADIYHLTSQNLATLLLFQRLDRPVIVTVHDIIPYLLRHDRRLSGYNHTAHRWFDYLAMRGLARADALLCTSTWTRDTLIRAFSLPVGRIQVVHLAVDHARFWPRTVPAAFRQRHRLEHGLRYLLYVGSEDPRKNIDGLLRAFAQIYRERRDVRLLKVGTPHHLNEHQQLRELAIRLGVDGAVRWFDHVADDELPLFYSLADLFVLPSLYEGFGLPALEAMACGVPVVCSNTTALPEVVGDAAVLVDPTPQRLSQAVLELLDDPRRLAALRAAGQRRAASFTWEATARAVLACYERVAGGMEERGP